MAGYTGISNYEGLPHLMAISAGIIWSRESAEFWLGKKRGG
jgi:hypothetical protein